MHIKVRLGLRDAAGEPFMGIGLVWLLRGVQRSGSLSASAREMGMSYSKAHGLVRKLEAALGCGVLARERGGSGRGGSSLTARGLRFLERFEALDASVKKQAEAIFRRSFPGGKLA
ncbi:MAG: LysR family transcriptional regulator [Elusimicrobia bacterium]|nr:LysR family transcriptional regulator [Elusimicrobiota bacterium]